MPTIHSPHTKMNRSERHELARHQARENADRRRKEMDEETRRRRRILVATTLTTIILIVALISYFTVNEMRTLDTRHSDGLTHATKVITSGSPNNINEYGGISLGSTLTAGTRNKNAKHQVDVYYSFSSNKSCVDFFHRYEQTLVKHAQAGHITLVLHPVATSQEPSSRIAIMAENLVAAKEPEKFYEFHTSLNENLILPYLDGNRPEPTAHDIVKIAQELNLEAETVSDLSRVLSNSLMEPWITEVAHQFSADGHTETPTVIVNDKKLNNWDTELQDFLEVLG